MRRKVRHTEEKNVKSDVNLKRREEE